MSLVLATPHFFTCIENDKVDLQRSRVTTPQLQYGHRSLALRAEAAIATPPTPNPRLPGAEAG